MTAAIICPKHLINTALLTELARATYGKILKIIGSGKNVDLSKYDEHILVYQYSLSSPRDEFLEFIEDNRNNLKGATVVIDIPQFYIESELEWAQKTKNLMSKISSIFGREENRVAVLNLEKLKEADQRRYAKDLEAEYFGKIDGKVLSKYSSVVVFNAKPYYRINSTTRRENLYIIAGIAAIPFGVLLFYLSLKHFSGGIGTAFISVVFGLYYSYIGYRNKKFAYWNGCDHQPMHYFKP